jgi:hypothetical protein
MHADEHIPITTFDKFKFYKCLDRCCYESWIGSPVGLIPSFPLTTMSSSEHILSPPSWGSPVAHKPKGPHPGGVELSVFDILNIFHRCWFL